MPSADSSAAPFSLEDLLQAYLDCRRSKRRSRTALEFEEHLERNLLGLYEELQSGRYTPGRSICFVVTHPKPREVWAASFRDRVVHHLLYNHIADRFHRRFIASSCACIPGRGTLYAVRRLEHDVRSITENWTHRAFYLKCDLANFFVSIHKPTLHDQLATRIHEPWWRQLAEAVLFHDPRVDVDVRCPPKLLQLVPRHKSLFTAPDDRGLPIGNLSSQFFANVYLDALDQHCKHRLRTCYYTRYVDDFVILHRSARRLKECLQDIERFLPETLGVHLNPHKTILQPVDRGVDFVGCVVKPWRTTVRRRVIATAVQRLEHMHPDQALAAANSYLGLTRHHAAHAQRARIARAAKLLGHPIAGSLTKVYPALHRASGTPSTEKSHDE
ncbi:MAG TPA: RNA-directed DNA polymerase [Pseudorhodoferax sp.]|nr:RNA-directed DNA polymerase [Pseudorhodoferax sp.]